MKDGRLNTYRDEEWLENLLADIWHKHFSDVEQNNHVRIRFGRRAKRRLGSIALDKNDSHTSVITINSLFRDLDVPEYIIVATIVHELSHYAHGFGSVYDQKHAHPHSGGVIREEFVQRGLEDLFDMQKSWLKNHWHKILAKYYPAQEDFPVNRRVRIAMPWWMRNV